MTGPGRPVNQRTSKWLNGLRRFEPRKLHQHLLRGSQLDRLTLRQEFEQLHQASPGAILRASVDPTEARKDAAHAHAVGGTELGGGLRLRCSTAPFASCPKHRRFTPSRLVPSVSRVLRLTGL